MLRSISVTTARIPSLVGRLTVNVILTWQRIRKKRIFNARLAILRLLVVEYTTAPSMGISISHGSVFIAAVRLFSAVVTFTIAKIIMTV